MALGGFLGGLANLGTVYGGFQQAQAIDQQNQLRQLQLQSLQNQQRSMQDTAGLLTSGQLNSLLGNNPLQLQQPAPLPAANIPQAGAPASLLPPAYSTPQQQTPSQPLLDLPQVPTIQAPPQLAGLQGGQFGGMGSGLPMQVPQPSPVADTTSPLGGFGTGLRPPQLASLSLGQPDLGGQPPQLPAGPSRSAFDLTGPPSGATVNMLTSTLDPAGLARGGATGQPVQFIPPYDPTAGVGDPRFLGATGGFGAIPQQTAAVPDTADTGGRAAVPGTADTGGGFGQVIQLESGGNMNIGRGSYGEVGPAQILPATFNQYAQPGEDINNPQTNLEVGKRYYDDLLAKSGGDQAAALVGYNRGPEAMRRFQEGGDNLDALRGTGMMPTVVYQQAIIRAGGKGEVTNVTNAVQTSRAMWNQSSSPQEKQASSVGTMSILQRYPFLGQALGTFDMDKLGQLIEKTYPNESPAVKVGIFQNMFNLLHPIAKERFAETIDLVKADIAEQERAETQRETARFHAAEEKHWAATEGGGGTIVQAGTPESPQYFRIPTRGGPAQPVEGLPGPVTRLPSPGGAGAAGGGLLKDELYQYTDKDGNPQQVTLRPKKGMAGYVIAAGPDQGKDFTLPQGAKDFIHISASTFGGGRAQAQTGRQLTGGAEVAVDLGNVADMPVGTTIGAFGTVEAGTSLSGALKGDLARELTNEDEINMKQAMSGIGRELSTLMNPVYGGKWASDQLDPLIPKAGYTVGNSLYDIARIRQSTENALESAIKSPLLSKEQKDYARQLQQQMREAIPWTVADVQAWIRGGDQQESFGDYVRRERVSGAAKGRGGASPTAAAPPAPTAPAATGGAAPPSGGGPAATMAITDIPGASLNDPDGTPYRNKATGEVWVKQGAQAVKQQ